MNLASLEHYLGTPNRYRRYTGVLTFIGGVAAVPVSAWAVGRAIVSLLGLAFVLTGLYDLYTSDFYRVVRPAGLITAGVGVVLVAVGLLQLWELLVLWPFAFVLFGTISLLSGILADRSENYSHP